jgi:hypothetical protein
MADSKKKGDKKPNTKDLDLATGIDRLPQFWNRHGNTVLIIITIAALAYSGWNWRQRSIEQARLTAQQNLATGRDALTKLQSIAPDANPEGYANYKRHLYEDGSAAVTDVLGKSDDKTCLAQALVLQGDLAYTVSLMPEGPAAATRPSLRISETTEQLLTKAKNSYQTVLSQYASEPNEAAAARFGLAAIAENAGDFAAAKTHYDAIAANESTYSAYREFAKDKIRRLPDLERPLRFRASTAPALPPPAVPLVTTQPSK